MSDPVPRQCKARQPGERPGLPASTTQLCTRGARERAAVCGAHRPHFALQLVLCRVRSAFDRAAPPKVAGGVTILQRDSIKHSKERVAKESEMNLAAAWHDAEEALRERVEREATLFRSILLAKRETAEKSVCIVDNIVVRVGVCWNHSVRLLIVAAPPSLNCCACRRSRWTRSPPP